MAEMAECILGCQKHVAVVPRLYNIKVEFTLSLPSYPLATMTILTSQYPGVSWLLFSLPRIAAPAFLVYTLISSSLGLSLGWDSLDGSRWKVAVASALTFPSVFLCSITWSRLKTAYRARKLGAITPPVIAGKLPGSFDIVWSAAKARFTAYPGEQTLTGVAFSVVARSPFPIGFDFIASPNAYSPTCVRCGIGDSIDQWLRESNNTMIFRIFFEDRVSGNQPT